MKHVNDSEPIAGRAIRNSGVKHLVFVGAMQPLGDCARNPWASAAMNMTQLELMQAMRAVGGARVTGLSLPGASASRTRPRRRPFKRSVLGDGLVIEQLPSFALGPVQVLTQVWSFTRRLLGRWPDGRPDAILVANPLSRFTAPALLAGWWYRIPVATIVADLTCSQPGQPPVTRFRNWLQTMMVRLSPGTIVFSSHTADRFRRGRPSIRMVRPPASSLLDLPQPPAEPAAHATYFAGSLSVSAGVDVLLDAIPLIKDTRLQFWFSGRGPLEDRLKQQAAIDPRIRFFGFVSENQYSDMLQLATVLVNPRPSRLLENRYNFPSKLMEYLAAGRPIISTATSDVAEHYGDAVVVLDDETPEGLARCIERVVAAPAEERANMGSRARAAVEGVTWQMQAKEILAFIETLPRRHPSCSVPADAVT
jgi:glycosyltransferase involved in cell wall biosynthesis